MSIISQRCVVIGDHKIIIKKISTMRYEWKVKRSTDRIGSRSRRTDQLPLGAPGVVGDGEQQAVQHLDDALVVDPGLLVVAGERHFARQPRALAYLAHRHRHHGHAASDARRPPRPHHPTSTAFFGIRLQCCQPRPLMPTSLVVFV